VASISKERNGHWRLRWRTPEGNSRSRTFTRKVDAERHLVAIEHSKNSGGYVDPTAGRTLLADLAEQWMESRLDIRRATRARDESLIRNHLLPSFGRS